MDSKGRYCPVEEEAPIESAECSSDLDREVCEEEWCAPTSLYPRLRVIAVAEVFLLAITLSIFLYALLAVRPLDGHDLVVATNAYSPLLDRIRVTFETKWVKSALLNRNNPGGPSIYAESPSPEVDKAWQALHEGDRFFLVAEHEVRRMGKDPDYAIKAPEEWNVGSNQYLAVNQGQHDIYCLDQLRKFGYSEYYYGNRTDELELEALHCLHTLLQTLHCKYSTNLYTAFWVDGFERPAVDFNVSRRCQVYDNTVAWNSRKSYTEEQFRALRALPDAKRIPKDIY